jgi:hypothetical protein
MPHLYALCVCVFLREVFFRTSRALALATPAIRLGKQNESVSICHAKAREDLTRFLGLPSIILPVIKISVKISINFVLNTIKFLTLNFEWRE